MSHELDLTTGVPAMAYVGETPWHKLGIRLLVPPSTGLEACQAAGIAYQVDKRQLYFASRAAMAPATNAFGLVREDTEAYLATVGGEYQPVQNAQLLSIFDPLIARGLATFETMGALHQGREIWGLIRFSGLPQEVTDNLAATGDQVLPYGLAFNAHGTGDCLELRDSAIRVVCNNTLSLARANEGGIRIPHRANILSRLEEAADELWGKLEQRYLVTSRRAAALREFRPLTKDQFTTQVLDEIARIPTPPIGKQLTPEEYKAFSRNYDLTITKRNKVDELWTGGRGHVGDLSAWEAYNGAAQALDHDLRSNRRLASMLSGNIHRTKTRIFNNLAELANAA